MKLKKVEVTFVFETIPEHWNEGPIRNFEDALENVQTTLSQDLWNEATSISYELTSTTDKVMTVRE